MDKKQQPRRLTAAESDAQFAHIPPEVKRAIVGAYLERLRAAGVEAELVTDAAGRTYFKVDMEQARAKLSPELIALFDEAAATSPPMASHTPPTA